VNLDKVDHQLWSQIVIIIIAQVGNPLVNNNNQSEPFGQQGRRQNKGLGGDSTF